MSLRRWLVLGLLALSPSICLAQEDVADVPSEKRQAGDDERKSYFLIPPATDTKPPQGFGLLIILPGGDGGESFHPFVKRIREHAVPKTFAVAQPIAIKWSPEQVVVWPTEKMEVEKQGFSTEDFVEAVIKDVATTHSLDTQQIFCMGWSSSGPAVYALALRNKPVVNGNYVAMSVFKPQQLPALANAKERSIYIEHSQQDRVCPFWMAQQGYQQLKREGARTTLVTYEGGHGWRGDVYGRIRRALQWLQTPPVGD